MRNQRGSECRAAGSLHSAYIMHVSMIVFV